VPLQIPFEAVAELVFGQADDEPHGELVVICREAEAQEKLAASISATTRAALQSNAVPAVVAEQQKLVLQPDPKDFIITSEGARATMRLAQALLAGYCAKLPGSDM
jgi:sarcosine oxidase gamma subunit